ncbi:MAG: RluA family pseudouridine synthase [Parcubacteria group bacterium]
MNLTVTPHYRHWRLDKFLTEKTGKTRSQVQRDILAGIVLVNGEPSKVHRFVELPDVIEIRSTKSEIRTNSKSEIKNPKSETRLLKKIKNIFTKHGQPSIIKKTKDYLIIEKPSHMLVHSTQKNETDTLVHWLIKKYPKTAKLEDPTELKKGLNTPYRPGIIHRLDREVSGLMIIPFNLITFEYFKNQFKTRQIKKEYIALVQGHLPEERGAIDLEISRSRSGKRMASHPHGSGKGKASLTEYELIERFPKYDLIKVMPKTGRTNQIRVHFFSIGHPIVGDTVYHFKSTSKGSFSGGGQNPRQKTNATMLVRNLPRPFLHAHKLTFIDPSGKTQVFESKLPKELEDCLTELKKLHGREQS